MENRAVKSFADLINEVRSRGICGGCGGCVSFCSAGQLNALHFGEDGLPEFANEEECLKCGICYLVCPQIRALDDELKLKFRWSKPVGQCRGLDSAKTTDPRVAEVATDGGVVTSLLLYALDQGLIEGAVVSRQVGPFSRLPAVATSSREIIDAAGSYFGEAPHLEEVGRSYTSFIPAVREVGKLRQRGLQKVAFVGTPCQVYSLRKMQLLKVVPSDAVVLVIGLFCMESFSFNEDSRRRLEKKIGINLDSVNKLNIKDDIMMSTADGEVLHLPFELMDDIARPTCFACRDFTNEFADISCGGLGSPHGYTTVMTRTDTGEQVFSGARHKGYLCGMKYGSKEQERVHRTTLMAKAVSFTARKQERAVQVAG
ncbi:MAG: Coenzyme F420 hydrogenase/dehydrogenase, beta subunit C-terminal domain [Spirochaetaceae bacterium]|nr:MAG: Coenzyme F420 hydrogenase/dehydrogenase, beta subunit C-terminal domain [Spirochaetaceae bacterium]